MKAHKVPATYYSAWNIPGKNHSFYVFYKSDVIKEGQSKSYKRVDSITQEHSYFMEEDFYYLDINKIPGIVYKLEREINDFFAARNYDIKCVDILDEEHAPNYPIIDVVDYNKYMYCRDLIDSWTILDGTGSVISNEDFRQDLSQYVFQKIGVIIEEDYFAHTLEPKWERIRNEIVMPRQAGDTVTLACLQDFLEFFVIQYIRVDEIISEYIQPTVESCKRIFLSMGYTEEEINDIEVDGMLNADSYFYAALYDIAKGNKHKLNNKMQLLEKNYIIDILHAPSNTGYITSTSPCVVSAKNGDFKSEMLFPVSPHHCVRFVSKSKSCGRLGQYFEMSLDEVKQINRAIVASSRNIVMSESKYLSDRI